MDRWVVFDAEGDGFTPTKFYCLCYKDYSGKSGSLTDYEEIREFFTRYDTYVGHNIRRWDLPQLKRVVEIEVPDGTLVIDTLAIAWYTEPDRVRHNLESYGPEFGVEKPKIVDWHSLSLDEYINRCSKDVEINYSLFMRQFTYLNRLYGDKNSLSNFLKYLDFKMYSAYLAEVSGWKLDLGCCKSNLDKLTKERDEKVEKLADALPKVPIVRVYERPQKLYNSDQQLSVLGLRWKDRLERAGLAEDHPGPVEEVVGYDRGNPSSSTQLKSWLYSLGWEPRTFKHTRNKKTGEEKSIPQINKEHGGGICDSIKELYDKEPNLELLDGLSVLNHRIAILSGFLRDVDEDGYLRASIAGLTNTLRFKHSVIVNLPKPEKQYGQAIRGSLIARDGYELCGSDMSSLEDRIKQHFIFKFDPEYVETLNTEGYDPHLDVGELAGGITSEQSARYKILDAKEDKTKDEKAEYGVIKKLRSIFKNGNYACQYGAGVPRLMVTCGISREDAARLHKAYWERNKAIKMVAEEQVIKQVDGQMWLYNPVSGFWYSLRYEKDIFSTLVQGTAAFCFDLYLRQVLNKRPQVTGQFHDEFILEVKEGFRDNVREFLLEAIEEVNELLGLNRELGVGIQFGKNYSEIH